MKQCVGLVIDEVYTHLMNTEGIHQQSHNGYLTQIPNTTNTQKLHYANINSNASKYKKNSARYDFAVRCAFDFVQPHMDKSYSLEGCDITALAGFIRKIDDSPCKYLFRTVRKEVSDMSEIRNMWAHCKYSGWD